MIYPTYAEISSKPDISELLKVFSTKSFSTVREDKFNGKPRHPLFPTPNNFRCKKLPKTQKGSSAKTFGTVRQNTFDRNSWQPPPLSFIRDILWYQNFSETTKVPPKILLRLWDEKCLTKYRDIPSYALNSSLPEISETLRATSTKSFATVTEDEFNRKTWDPLSLTPDNFRCKKLPDLQKGSSAKSFSNVRQKISEKMSWYTLLCIKFLDTRYHWNTKRIFQEKFRYFEEVNVNGRSWQPLSLTPKIFRYKETFWNTEGFLNEKFWFFETKRFRRKVVIPPPPHISLTFFDARSCLQHKRVPLDFFH